MSWTSDIQRDFARKCREQKEKVAKGLCLVLRGPNWATMEPSMEHFRKPIATTKILDNLNLATRGRAHKPAPYPPAKTPVHHSPASFFFTPYPAPTKVTERSSTIKSQCLGNIVTLLSKQNHTRNHCSLIRYTELGDHRCINPYNHSNGPLYHAKTTSYWALNFFTSRLTPQI